MVILLNLESLLLAIIPMFRTLSTLAFALENVYPGPVWKDSVGFGAESSPESPPQAVRNARAGMARANKMCFIFIFLII
jgi:hypothetical protein